MKNDDFKYSNLKDGTIKIKKYYGEVSNLTIPDTIDGKPVTILGNRAFYRCNILTYVTVPNSVTNIGRSTFFHCDNLTGISFPNSIKSIGDSSFFGCSKLKVYQYRMV